MVGRGVGGSDSHDEIERMKISTKSGSCVCKNGNLDETG